jgi:hypothetical protein
VRNVARDVHIEYISHIQIDIILENRRVQKPFCKYRYVRDVENFKDLDALRLVEVILVKVKGDIESKI